MAITGTACSAAQRPWTLAVLVNGGRRYQDLHDVLDGVSHQVLTDTLRQAERDGPIARHLDANRAETAALYELTDLGRSLDEPLATFERWVEADWHCVEATWNRWVTIMSRKAPVPS
jgi:DNA-binding HxlR family transcriptional regulator